jgi:hypothetical protein
MTIYLFAGPSLPRTVRERYAARATVLPPVAAGDLPRLPARPGDVVGIIDGFFHRRPAVRHKEILDLLDRGVQVHGAASMGALRAAELAAFGMRGHGRIFADYHSGAITADDEVALLHGTEAEDYELYTEALVNIRYALADAAAKGLLAQEAAETVLHAGARLPFTERTREALVAAAANCGIAGGDLAAVQEVLDHVPDAKQQDALALLNAILGEGASRPSGGAGRSWRLQETLHLRHWRSAARGGDDPVAGWVPEEQVHRLAQVLAVDYPAFRERIGVRYLATQHALTTGPLAALASPVAGCPRSKPAVGSVPRVLERLRDLGLLAPGASADPGLDRWCTTAERHLPDQVRIAKAASRALFPHAALAWHDPFLAELKAAGTYPVVHERLVDCLRFHRELRQQRPTLQLAQLRSENILAHFAQRWGREDLQDAVLERGFATVHDFLATARSFYLYDKAHPDAEPLVLQATVARGS